MADIFVSSMVFTIPYSTVPAEVTKDKLVARSKFTIGYAGAVEEEPGKADLSGWLPWLVLAIAALMILTPDSQKKAE